MDDLRQTLIGAGQSEENGFEGAQPKMEIRYFHETKRGVTFRIHIYMADQSGKPHRVWHILSGGRRPFIQKRRSPPIKERVRNQRTAERRLRTAHFSGYTGKTFAIPAGTRVAGIQARNWYDVVKRYRIRDVHKRWPGWTIQSITVVERL